MEEAHKAFHVTKLLSDKSLKLYRDAVVIIPFIYFSQLIASLEPYIQESHKKSKLYPPFKSLTSKDQNLLILCVLFHQWLYSLALNLYTICCCHAGIELLPKFLQSKIWLAFLSFFLKECYSICRIALLLHKTQVSKINSHPKSYMNWKIAYILKSVFHLDDKRVSHLF